MCNRNNNDCDNCIMEILKVINVLQSNACPDSCLQSCDRPALGGGPNCIICNTRPIMLYTCAGNGTPWSMPTSRSEAEGTTSNVFRVEKVDGCCCTFRVLAPNPDETSTYPYVGTDSLFTMNANCICSVRCLNDTYIECV
ncbi:MAG: hypothetical protein IKR57_01185 [Bacilli bacterium]|nr:hypothetical protein [Bacilli bacterium]